MKIDKYKILDRKIPADKYEVKDITFDGSFSASLFICGEKYQIKVDFINFESFAITDRDNRCFTFDNARNLEDWYKTNDGGIGNPIYILGQESNFFDWLDNDSYQNVSLVSEAFHIAIVTRSEIIDCITSHIPNITVSKIKNEKK